MSKQWAWQPITWTHTYTDSFGFVRLDCDADRITALVDGMDDRDFSFAHDEDVRLCRRVPAAGGIGVPMEVWNTIHVVLKRARRSYAPVGDSTLHPHDQAIDRALAWLDAQAQEGE